MKLYVQLDPSSYAVVTLEIRDRGPGREPTLQETVDTVQSLRSSLLLDTPGSQVSLHDPEIPY